jgi:hypothetical protein
MLCVAMVFHSLTQYIYQDEDQYVTAAYLAQHMRLYADFLYFQPPIYPLILSSLLMLFSSVSPFLVARLLSAALAVGSVVVFFRLAVRLADSERVAVILASLFASAPLMLLAYGWTRNDIMPIFFGLCGVWFALRGLRIEGKQTSSYPTYFLAGVCMALAVGTKVSAAFIPLSATLYIFFRAKPGLLPLVLGGAVGSVPTLYYGATAFDRFLYCNLTYHLTAPVQYYTDNGMAEAFTWSHRVTVIARSGASEPALVLAALFTAFAVFIAWRRGRLSHVIRQLLVADRSFVLLLVFVAIPFVLLPKPASGVYLQPAVPYALLSCAALYPLARRIMERPQLLLFVVMSVVALTLQIGQFVIEAGQHLNRLRWTTAEVHDLSALIARNLKGGIVATVYPLLVLDAGGLIYPEFATGIFFFRSGDHLGAERVLELNGISPRTLPLVFNANPPAGVFVGSTDIDLSLLNWAMRLCYNEIDLTMWKGGPYVEDIWRPRLFVRPREPTSCRRE